MYFEDKTKEILSRDNIKKVIIYGFGIIGSIAIYQLKKLGYKVDYIVDGDVDKQGKIFEFCGEKIEVRSPFDLMYENKNEIFVFIAIYKNEGVAKILESMGIEVTEENYILCSIYEEMPYLDPLLSYSRGKKDFVSMSNYENEQEKCVILTLGGSTTDYSYYGIRSWPKYLQELCGTDVKIYNGGVCGYTSCQELLKLMRDGFTYYKPDIVISYSGVNDALDVVKSYTHDALQNGVLKTLVECFQDNTGKECKTYYGRKEEMAGRYINNMRMMKRISEEFGAKFYGFLQPNMTDSDYEEIDKEFLTAIEPVKKDVEKINLFNKEVKSLMKEYPYLYDYTSIMKDEKECFYDHVHCTEKGNEIIAKTIYNQLKKDKLI